MIITVGDVVLLMFLGFVATMLLVSGIIIKNPILSWGAAGAWLLTGITSIVLSVSAWDILYGIGFFFVFFGIATALFAGVSQHKDASLEDHLNVKDDEDKEFKQTRKRVRSKAIRKRQRMAANRRMVKQLFRQH